MRSLKRLGLGAVNSRRLVRIARLVRRPDAALP